MSGFKLEISDQISEEYSLPIEAGLGEFNDAMSGINDRQPLAVVVRSPESGKVVGGMLGRSSLGVLFIDLFYLPPELRAHGLGSEILKTFEAEGCRRGCVAGFLYTISFQAPDFYRKHGWEAFGKIDCLPEGTSRFFMKKTL
ncbi:GNAT family N-acetyltransferase [Cedecea neteri]|uniref:GCN5 family acetyltransferase n=1 Tax=Cedecea neteri TaxID=158822 RepID=A0AAN0VU24_9ENTR|nr:GNAT family N-acetyltransferase [Cedecea neteri]AIR61764.1 GCN5 family acetyltransferase [Cedecea neteri]WNJ77867.1 GNAT family N-acetyltransferase [Cedecea neteri]